MKFKVAALQSGSFEKGDTYESYMKKHIELLERCVKKEKPYLVQYSETMTGPYFCGVKDDKYFDLAETMDGKTCTTFIKKAKELNVHIVFSMFEKAVEFGQTFYYNTLVLVSPTRGIAGKYRKNHMPWNESALYTYEKYYFKPGSGFPVYRLDNGAKIGMLLCYDRSFPESWRVYALQGVDIVFMAACTWGYRGKLFLPELAIRAAETGAYVIATNRAGDEQIENEDQIRNHFGSSGIIDPFGEVMCGLGDEKWEYTAAEIDMDTLKNAHGRKRMRDRRPELYGLISAAGVTLCAPDYNPDVDEML